MDSIQIETLIDQIGKLQKKRWLTPNDVESEFGISKSTQAKMRMSGRLPYSKIGSLVRYDRQELDELWEGCKVVSMSHSRKEGDKYGKYL